MTVSVVVPIYQAADTVAACIDSLRAQTHGDLDIVLVDDGSGDESGRICDEQALLDTRIRVVHQPNRGRTAARWEGTLRATGEWLTYVDADDRLMPDAVERLLRQASDDTDIVMGNARSIGCGTGTLPLSEFRHKAVRGDGTIGVPWGSLYRRSALTAYLFDLPRDIMNGEDYIFWLRLVFQTQKPVRTLRENVYLKGEEHTCRTFVWTSDYCYRLNRYRMESIPAEQRDEYLPDTLEDRITNLFAATLDEPRSVWARHAFFADLRADLQRLGQPLPLRRRFFLALPGRHLRRLYSHILTALSERFRK